MARVSTYLNFQGNTEEALEFYKKVFGTDFSMPIMRLGDVPPDPNMPQITEEEKAYVMHAELPILAGHVLMATDMVESMGQQTKIGNNTTINLEPDTLAETRRLFEALSDGATDVAPLAEQFWGSTWGCLLDRYGIRWMFNGPVEDSE